MDDFLGKLKILNLFLVERNGDLILKGRKGKLTEEEIETIKKNHFIIDFIKNNKAQLVEHLIKGAQKVRSIYKLSPLQEGMLFHHLYDPSSIAYLEQIIVDFPTGINLQVFKSSWEYVVKNHSILRTSFIYDQTSIPVQCAHPEVELPIKEIDYSHFAQEEQEAAIKKYLQEDQKLGFDFSKAPLMRIGLIKLTDQCWKMVWTFHHILIDGWSKSIVIEEFLSAYDALSNGKVPLKKKEDVYEDFIKFINASDKHSGEVFWKEYLEGFEQASLLPFVENAPDRNRGGEDTAEFILNFDERFTEKIVHFAQSHRITVNTLVQGVWSFLLSKYTGNSDVVFGVTVSGRPPELEASEQRVGLYINTLPLRTKIDETEEVSVWLAKIQTGNTQAREFQHTALSDIQQWSKIQGDFFDSVLVFENYPVGEAISKGGNLDVGAVEVQSQTNYLLYIAATMRNYLKIRFGINATLLSNREIEMISSHFEEVIYQIVDQQKQNLSDLTLVSTKERNKLLVDFNQTLAPYPQNRTILELFDEQVRRNPEKIALVFGAQKLSYKTLDQQANQLAHHLLTKGLKNQDKVGILAYRGFEMMISVFAVLKCGAVYVPLNIGYPTERLNYILKDAGVTQVVCSHGELLKEAGLEIHDYQFVNLNFLSDFPKSAPTLAAKPDDGAYVMYTSGTTGQPKGILVSHQNIVKLSAEPGPIAILPEDRVLQWSNFSFDGSTYDIYNTLLNGATLYLISEEEARDPGKISSIIRQQKITVSFITTVLFNAFVDDDLTALTGLRKLLFGGEKVSVYHVKKALKTLNEGVVVHMYGPTETTVYASYYPINSVKRNQVPIGVPLANTRIYIVDTAGRPAGIGVVGEIWIGGDGVAKGYLNREALTSEKFISDPFSESPHARLYKTGDMARYLPDGNIEFVGRIDAQVKMRGYRIELGEIEAILHESTAVDKCVVIADEDPTGTKRLVAYIVPSGLNFDKKSIQEFLEARLPDYMVPALMVELAELPITPNGKIDRKALPNVNIMETQLVDSDYPQTATEILVGNIWRDLLKVEDLSIHSSFFEVGGHSLLAMRIISIIRKDLKLALAVSDVFYHPTIKRFATFLDSQKKEASLPEITSDPRPEKIPLSYSQERLWFIDQFEGSIQYHMPTVLRLQNELDKTILEESLAGLIQRHEVLRTVIKAKAGQPYQEIMPVGDWRMGYSEGDEFMDETHLANFVSEEINRPFDLSTDYMFRAHLVKSGVADHVLILVIHHIVSDGWSQSILVKDLVELYRARQEERGPNLPPLPVQYADYAIWQRKHLSGDFLAAQLQWWTDQLNGVEALELPTDFPRPSIQSTKGAGLGFLLEKNLMDGIKALANKSGASLFMTLLSAFKILLHRYSGQTDICVGTPLANRNQQEVEPLVGFFINTLALRSSLSGNPRFMDFLEQVKEKTLVAFSHQEVPFEQIVDQVEVERSLSRNPIFQVMFILQNTPETPDLELGNLSLSSENTGHSTSLFDLYFTVTETAEGARVGVEYCTDLFHRTTIERMADHFQQLLESIVANPNEKIAQLSLVPQLEKQQILTTFNATGIDYGKGRTVIDLFEEQAAKSPEKTALVFQGRQLSYQRLNELSNQLARYIRDNSKFQEGDSIGVMMERSEWSAIAMIGIMKLGGVYVPIPSSYPDSRIVYMLENSESNIVLTNDKGGLNQLNGAIKQRLDLYDGAILSSYAFTNLDTKIATEGAAFIIYTSGSTGKPKGVVQTHLTLYNLVKWSMQDSGQVQEASYLQYSSFSFDMSLYEIYFALGSGGDVHIVPEALRTDFYALKNYIVQEEIEVLSMPYSVLKLIFDEVGLNDLEGHHIQEIISAGEQLYISGGLRSFLQTNPKVQLYNLYGPSETHAITGVGYSFANGELPKEASIGKPISNTAIYILDQHLQAVPIGVEGEIYAAGVGLALGYKGNEAGTQERFVDNPLNPGERVYKTGDLGKWLPDGQIAFKGRVDDQVKINGFRIELGEIENWLIKSDKVKNGVVLAKDDGQGDRRLVAFVVPKPSSGEHEDYQQVLQEYLSAHLPAYMVPSIYMELDELPLTSTGKIDKIALGKLEVSVQTTEEYVAPRNSTEETLAQIWMGLLRLDAERVGIHDNFFALGGHSLLVTRLVSAIREEFSINIPVKVVFEFPTIAKLQEYIRLMVSSQDEANYQESEVFEL